MSLSFLISLGIAAFRLPAAIIIRQDGPSRTKTRMSSRNASEVASGASDLRNEVTGGGGADLTRLQLLEEGLERKSPPLHQRDKRGLNDIHERSEPPDRSTQITVTTSNVILIVFIVLALLALAFLIYRMWMKKRRGRQMAFDAAFQQGTAKVDFEPPDDKDNDSKRDKQLLQEVETTKAQNTPLKSISFKDKEGNKQEKFVKVRPQIMAPSMKAIRRKQNPHLNSNVKERALNEPQKAIKPESKTGRETNQEKSPVDTHNSHVQNSHTRKFAAAHHDGYHENQKEPQKLQVPNASLIKTGKVQTEDNSLNHLDSKMLSEFKTKPDYKYKGSFGNLPVTLRDINKFSNMWKNKNENKTEDFKIDISQKDIEELADDQKHQPSAPLHNQATPSEDSKRENSPDQSSTTSIPPKTETERISRKNSAPLMNNDKIEKDESVDKTDVAS